MQENQTQNRKSLKQGIYRGILIFAVLIIIAVSATVCMGVVVMSSRHYAEDSFEAARVAVLAVNGDKTDKYLNTGEKDSYYEATEEYLRRLVEEYEMIRISVFVPGEEGIVYLWDTGEGQMTHELGEREEYGADKDYVLSAFVRNPGDVLVKYDEGDDSFQIVYYPVFNSNGDPVAIAAFVVPLLRISSIVAQFIAAIILATAAMSGVMMFIAYSLINKRMLKPLGILTESAGKMVDNLEKDEVINIDIHTNDEFETLAEAFTRMDVDLKEYIRRLSAVTAEKQRIDTELDIASQIQMGFLPKLEPPFSDNSRFEIFGSMSPAREVGGDFYDFFMLDDRHLVLTVGDVSGKGVPAAIFMVVIKILLRNCLHDAQNPSAAVETINRKILENNDLGYFATMWLAVIDLETGKGISVNAGHEHPAFRQEDGFYELVRYMHSPPVAAAADVKFAEKEFELRPGDSVFVYTDGVTEASNGNHHQFGEDRLLITLNKYRDSSPQELIRCVKTAIDEFAGDEPQFDDITMLAFRFDNTL